MKLPSPSKRLRNALFIVWKQSNPTSLDSDPEAIARFENFYRSYIENLIASVHLMARKH